jgi:DNA-binding FadR family transcriptional regulator
VREALIALEVEGRLKIRVGSGIYVVEQQPAAVVPGNAAIEGPLELLRARAFVESAVAEEAAVRARTEDIERLDEILIEVDHRHSGDELIALDRRFHAGIAAILDNAVLVRFVGQLFDQRINPYFEQLARHIENASTWKETHLEHVVIRDAIAARDPLAARAAMRNHLQQALGRFSRDFEGRCLNMEGAACFYGRRHERTKTLLEAHRRPRLKTGSYGGLRNEKLET